MKVQRDGFRMLQREQLLQELVHDSYKAKHKLPEPSVCPRCSATFHEGRWTWRAAPTGTPQHMCPACSRIMDEFPAGYVTVTGEFAHEHRDEITQLIKHCELSEKAEHPLERIMGIADVDDGLLVTTTDSHLARKITERLHRAFKGKMEFRYNKEDNLLRARWSR